MQTKAVYQVDKDREIGAGGPGIETRGLSSCQLGLARTGETCCANKQTRLPPPPHRTREAGPQDRQHHKHHPPRQDPNADLGTLFEERRGPGLRGGSETESFIDIESEKSTRLDGMIIGLFLPLRDGRLGVPLIVPVHRWQEASRVASLLPRTSDGRGSTDSTQNGREDGRFSKPRECSESETMGRQMKEKWCEISTRRLHGNNCLSSEGESFRDTDESVMNTDVK